MKWQDVSVDIKTLSPGGCLPLILTYPQQSGERYRTNGPLVFKFMFGMLVYSRATISTLEVEVS